MSSSVTHRRLVLQTAVPLFLVIGPSTSSAADVTACSASNHSTVVCNNVTILVGDAALGPHVDRLATRLSLLAQEAARNGRDVTKALAQVQGVINAQSAELARLFAVEAKTEELKSSFGVFGGDLASVKADVTGVVDQLLRTGIILDDHAARLAAAEKKIAALQASREGLWPYSTRLGAFVLSAGVSTSRPWRTGATTPAARFGEPILLEYRFRLRRHLLVGIGADIAFSSADDRVVYTSGEPGGPVLDRTAVSTSYSGPGMHVGFLVEDPGWHPLLLELRASAMHLHARWNGDHVPEFERWRWSFPLQLIAHLRMYEGFALWAGPGVEWIPRSQPVAIAYGIDGRTTWPAAPAAETRWLLGGGLEYAWSGP